MEIHAPSTHSAVEPLANESLAELGRLGDEIAELSAHLTAATARLLDLIRQPRTIRVTCSAVPARPTASKRSSVARVATRVSSRTLE